MISLCTAQALTKPTFQKPEWLCCLFELCARCYFRIKNRIFSILKCKSLSERHEIVLPKSRFLFSHHLCWHCIADRKLDALHFYARFHCASHSKFTHETDNISFKYLPVGSFEFPNRHRRIRDHKQRPPYAIRLRCGDQATFGSSWLPCRWSNRRCTVARQPFRPLSFVCVCVCGVFVS